MASTPIATVLNSTLTRSRKKLIMASIKSNALMAWAFANNRVEFEEGGHEITNPLTLDVTRTFHHTNTMMNYRLLKLANSTQLLITGRVLLVLL